VNEIDSIEFNRLREKKSDSEKKIFIARERIRQLEEHEYRLNRYFNPDNDAHAALKKRLQSQKADLKEGLRQVQEHLIELNEQIGVEWEKLIPFTDPKAHLNRLDEKYPILLMPLRIETRFKKVKREDNRVQDQLWVRVYPDDCSIDTFEEPLSEGEIRDAKKFWMDWWAAAGDEGKRRAAWRTLADGHGYGRAQHIINKYQPADYTDILNSGDDLVNPTVYLIIDGHPEIKTVEMNPLAQFWIAVWNARGDGQAIDSAREILEDEIGAERANFLATEYPPVNINDPAPLVSEGEEIDVEVKFIAFPTELEIDSQKEAWSQAPKVKIMPERLYLLCFRNQKLEIEVRGNLIPFPLVTGPDPQMKKDDLVEITGTDLKVTKDMRWMIDFEDAKEKGMAFRVDLDPDQAAQGFERLLVVGVKMTSNRSKGKSEIEELIRHHYFGNAGFSFLPVGTPTNNTLDAPSGYSDSEDADESFDLIFKQNGEIGEQSAPPDWWLKSDRQWFCEMLGISEDTFQDMINTDGYDQQEARAMNVSLWPTTWGYFFETMLDPVLENKQIENIRWYFNHFVIGRGTIPSIRIDDQPYGILPTTVFSRIGWINEKQFPVPTDIGNDLPSEFPKFMAELMSRFKLIHADWRKMLNGVSYVGKDGDPHQLLLDILGLHGGSVEFHRRIGQSLNHIYNLYKLNESKKSVRFGLFSSQKDQKDEVTIEQVLKAVFSSVGGRLLLQRFGYDGDEDPEILTKLFVLNAEKLTGPLIDDLPLSEINPIRTYSNGTDGHTPENYIDWLIRTASDSLDNLRKESGFIDDIPPNALLYLMLRHALELGFWDAGLRLYDLNEVIDAELLQFARKEPDFIHIRPALDQPQLAGNKAISSKPIDFPFHSESRYNLLYQKQPQITQNPDLLVAEYIPLAVAQGSAATQYLAQQINALKVLKNTPTARLERIFVEHLDCASYRFDAWKFGITNFQLKAIRNRQAATLTATTEDASTVSENQGLYVGAYGWLENVQSENKELTPKALTPELADVFQPTAENPIFEDKTNLGYIAAPSLNHAVTAAILRNGFLSRADKSNANAFNINLTSGRVRKALQIIEGIQNGQSLAALLGYLFERGIHDNNIAEKVDHFIHKIRRKFPLVANQLKSTHEDDNSLPIEALEARNVVDGLELIEFAESKLGPNGEPNYFDALNLGPVTNAEKNIIVSEINNIRDMHDAVADLAFAESIHQVVQGNIDRAAGTLDTYSSGNYPQVPDVIQTPRSGVNLTHRLGIQINADADPNVGGYTPRAMGEPGLNEMLGNLLPDLDQIRCYVSFSHIGPAAEVVDHPIRMSDLQLQPIDLLYMVETESEQAMTDLDDLIIDHTLSSSFAALGNQSPRPDTEIKIKYFKKAAGSVSIFEVAPLIYHLKALLLRSRPLRASDVIMSNEAGSSADVLQKLDRSRVDLVLGYLTTKTDALLDNKTPVKYLDDYIALLTASTGENGDDDATIISKTDERLDAYIHLLRILALTGLPQTGTGFAYDWRKTQIKLLMKKVHDLVEIWDAKDQEYTDMLADYGALSDEEKIERLLEAEKIISTIATLDPGNDPVAFKNLIDGKKSIFDHKKKDFDDFISGSYSGISSALAQANTKNIFSYADYYLVTTDISDIEKACIAFTKDLLNKAVLLQKDLNKRIAAATQLLLNYEGEAESSQKIQYLQDAAKQLLTEEFKMIPSFELASEHIDEWQNALNQTDELLDYQINTLQNPLPVDEWFYGVARVREKVEHFEQAVFLAEGFKNQNIELIPVQFPRIEPHTSWFAMEFGHTDALIKKELNKAFRENDHLLYTALYHTAFDPSKDQCGLLIDEWTETVPTEEETMGITFHYDRPNSEPPQTMLLALSPQLSGEGWIWADLIDILHETLKEAKLRAVEPEQIDKTGYANLLPATVSTVTKYPISIMLNYAFNAKTIGNV
jgi:hypothetical protein